jgi:hypothetical protein
MGEIMVVNRWLRAFVPLALSLVLFVTACTPKSSSRYADIQKETSRRNAPAAVAKAAEAGGTFNKFFPGSTGTYEVVPAQEKKGFAEYKLNQNGKTVAMLAVNDTAGLPTAAAKFKGSTDEISGYPAVEQGTTATGILINDRYQVKVLSRDPSFTRDDRVAWLQKFDLKGLAKLEAGESTAATPAPTVPKNKLGRTKTAPETSRSPEKPILQPAT